MPPVLAIHLRPSILIAAPKVLQVVSAAASDWYTWQLAVKLYGRNSMSSWFAVGLTPSVSHFLFFSPSVLIVNVIRVSCSFS